jgi:hypothetical protein
MSHYVQSETKRKPGRPRKSVPGTHPKGKGFGKYHVPTELEKFQAVKAEVVNVVHTPTMREAENFFAERIGGEVPIFGIPRELWHYIKG